MRLFPVNRIQTRSRLECCEDHNANSIRLAVGAENLLKLVTSAQSPEAKSFIPSFQFALNNMIGLGRFGSSRAAV